jgi:DNA-binding beta-propeller fold protein YncE
MRNAPTRNRFRAVRLALATAALLIASSGLATMANAADPPLLWKTCLPGSGAGQCENRYGLAVDPATGNVYVGDVGQNRIAKFSPWGVFLEAWGWGVANGEAKLQSCGPKATPPTTCKAGLEGSGVGQLRHPRGVAVDSNGDVFVVDGDNHRVQKFDSQGNFLLMFGGEVDQGGGTPSNPGALCTAEYVANGDTCGIGATGTGPGQFSAKWALGSYIAFGSGNLIYVGDQDRIQKFDMGGHHVGQIPLPEAGVVKSLAADPDSGDLYMGFESPVERFSSGERALQPNVYRLDSVTGSVKGKVLEARIPTALATDAAGNVYIVDANSFNGNDGDPVNHKSRILQYDPDGELLTTMLQDVLNPSFGIATGSACGIAGTDLYVSQAYGVDGFVGSYGPPPNPSLCPPPEAAPSITSTYALSADMDGASVQAEINPHFFPDTQYNVQYGLGKCSEGGCDREQPGAPGSLLTKNVLDVSVKTAGVFLGDLAPDTTYYYRFVAQSGGGSETGPERSFHTFPNPIASANPDPCPNAVLRTSFSAKLPDCRAYEMVSPLDKNNGDISVGEASFNQSAADGGALTFSSFRAFADPAAAPLVGQYLAVRSPEAGWSSRSISPPRSAVPLYPIGSSASNIQFKAFTDDLCTAWMLQDTSLALAPKAPVGFANIYRRDNCEGDGYDLLTTVAPPNFEPNEVADSHYNPQVQGFSADGDEVVFRANDKLAPNACATKGVFQVYEAYEAGKLRLVSVLPSGAASCVVNASVGTAESGNDFRRDNVHNALSADGSRVFWTTSTGSPEADQPGQLYLRLNATQAPSKVVGGECTEAEKACTIAVSSDATSRFWTADPQGTTAIYTTGSIGGGGLGEAKLYEFDVGTKHSQLIAEGVKGVMGSSEDASRVYFVSSESLTGAPNSEGEVAEADQPNLYLYERGSGLRFLATLGTYDVFNDANGPPPSPISIRPDKLSSRITSDGLHAIFSSEASLTGYDNHDVDNGVPDSEIYIYDATADGGNGDLSCVSCNPTGARPSGRDVATFLNGTVTVRAAAEIPGWESQTHPGRLLSADGRRLFFNSFDALVPRDTNGKTDVYEWQAAEDSQECRSVGADVFAEAASGCLSLISSGESPSDSEFFDASATGSDVFFATLSSLLPQDYGLMDIYDARVNGGFPPSPVPAPVCEGEACQRPLVPPNDPTPGSSSYTGPGNPKSAPKKAKKKSGRKRHKKHARSAKKKTHQRADAGRSHGHRGEHR